MMKKILIYSLLLTLTILIVACNYSNQETAVSPVASNDEQQYVVSPTTTTKTAEISINESIFTLSLDTPATYDVASLSSLTDNYFNATIDDNYQLYLNDVALKNNVENVFSVEKIDQEYQLELKIVDIANNIETISYINTYPQALEIEPIEDNLNADGYYYFSPRGWLLKLDTDGALVYYKSGSGLMHFNRTEVDGNVYYSYAQSISVDEHPKLEDAAYGTVKAVIMDENYRIIDEIDQLVASENAPEGIPLDSHQLEILGKGHYLLSAYVPERVTNFPDGVAYSANGAMVVNAVVQEIKDGELLFEWSSTDHPELYAHSVRENDYFNETLVHADYTHFNCAKIDPRDENILISLKNLDAVLKVDRQSSDIIWILGGVGDQFGLTDTQKFEKQHDVKVSDDGSIMLFDNGGDDVDSSGQTRILKIYLDETTKTITDFKSYQLDGVFTYSQGSAQEIKEGHFVISLGSTLEPYYSFQEINFNTNEVLFSAGSNENAPTYKAFRYDE